MSSTSVVSAAFPVSLLDPAPIALETGVQRLSSGALLVAARNNLPHCSGAMFDWWFKHFTTDNDLRLWHPVDHKAHLGWDQKHKSGKSYIGATIHAVESLGDIPPVPAVLKFIDPHDFFGDAMKNAPVSAAVCSGIGFGKYPALDETGIPRSGRMAHICRDRDDGLVLRSRFLLGLDGSDVPERIGLGLMQHCLCEFSWLAKALPSLYYADPDTPQPKSWW